MSQLKKKIVIIEDEIDILELENMILTNAGYEVHMCDNGREAFDLIKQVRPHLVILDVMLPGCDGKTIVQAVSEDDEINNTSIIIVSALEESERMFLTYPQVRDFCVKPFRAQLLLEKVKVLMGDA